MPIFIRRTAVQIYTKLSYEARHRHLRVGAVMPSLFFSVVSWSVVSAVG
ncbi:MAG: hypothetical protein IAE98_05860 [Candidatus Kapabacteria bacterium]|nr:hypothetical protein [Candidatus Kapabacteria bacterium]